MDLKRKQVLAGMVVVLSAGSLLVWAQEKKANAESERQVTEKEVPAAALAALKKMAGGTAITEFAEEIEHGHKFYEGSWKGPDGNVDGLVTEAGDVVELEESIPADKVPASARGAVEKEAGVKDGIHYEKKTYVAYEAHFKKDGKSREVIFTPDGRRYVEQGEGENDADHDEDEDKE